MSAALDFKADPSHSSAVKTEDLEPTEAYCFETTPNCELIVSVALIAISALASANFALGAGVGLCFAAVLIPATKAIQWSFSLETPAWLLQAYKNIAAHPGEFLLCALVENGIHIGLMPLSSWAFSMILPEMIIGGFFGAPVTLVVIVSVVALALIHVLGGFFANEGMKSGDYGYNAIYLVGALVYNCVLGLLTLQVGAAAAIGYALTYNVASISAVKYLEEPGVAQPAHAEV